MAKDYKSAAGGGDAEDRAERIAQENKEAQERRARGQKAAKSIEINRTQELGELHQTTFWTERMIADGPIPKDGEEDNYRFPQSPPQRTK